MKRRIEVFVLVFLLYFMLGVICVATQTDAKAAKPTSGKDTYGNTWVYDETSRTLTFSGKGKAGANLEMNGHDREPEWKRWAEEVECLAIEEGITEIGDGSFYSMWSMKQISFPTTLRRLGKYSFQDCNLLMKVELPQGLVEIGDFSFWGCSKLEQILMSEGLKKIGESAFDMTKLEEIELPNSVTHIGRRAFFGCKSLRKITMSQGLKKIAPETFSYCKNLRAIEIPDSVTSIGISAFAGTGIREITIPKNVTKLYREKIDYGDKKYDGIFTGCKKLRKVTIQSQKIKKLCPYSLSKTNKKAVIKVPKSKLKKYRKMFTKAGLSKKVKVKRS